MATDVADRDDHERGRKRSGPITFFREVRAEARKVTWASRQETIAYTIMVLVMVALMAAFFFVVDTVLHGLVAWVLGLIQ